MDCKPMIGQAWWLLGPSTLGETQDDKTIVYTRFRTDISVSDGTDILRDDIDIPPPTRDDA